MLKVEKFLHRQFPFAIRSEEVGHEGRAYTFIDTSCDHVIFMSHSHTCLTSDDFIYLQIINSSSL